MMLANRLQQMQINTAYDVGFCDGCEEVRPAY